MIKAVGFYLDGELFLEDKDKEKLITKLFKDKGVKKSIKKSYNNPSWSSISTIKKVENLLEEFLPEENKINFLNETRNKLEELYTQKIVYCPLIKCINIIEELKEQTDMIFLISKEEESLINNIIEHCNLNFDEVLAGPRSKQDNFKKIMKDYKLTPEEILYFSDSVDDITLSRKIGIKMAYMQGKFSYKKMLKSLEADFVFSNYCKVPKNIISN